MDYPSPFEGYANTSDSGCPEIHIGVDSQNIRWYDYEDTIQHELIHCFELSYGYTNKNLNYNIDDEEYQKSFSHFDNVNNLNNEFDWQLQDYYGTGLQFSSYLTNLISLFKQLYARIGVKDKLKQLLLNTNFSDYKSVRKLCGYCKQNQIYNIVPLFWLYHLKNENQNLFKTAIIKLTKKIEQWQ